MSDLPEFIRASDLSQTASMEADAPSSYLPWRKDESGEQWFRRIPNENMRAILGVPADGQIEAEEFEDEEDDDFDDDDFYVADDETEDYLD